ncbi:MAG: hypothetical protein K2H98_05745 [Duncaniella sp.]|nr:hypothetical protein [Duncaniella sp.]
MQLSKTDALTTIRYLEDALRLYDALAAIPMQKCKCRAHMIRQHIIKLKSRMK